MDLFHSPSFASRVDGLLHKYHAPGVAVAIVQNTTVASAGYGFVTLDPKKPMTPDTLFDIASASKSLTAASVALLVDDNDKFPNVTYEATMSSLLPEDFVMSEESYTKGVTVEDVLSHRTGVAPHDESYLGPKSNHTDNAKSVTRNLRNLAVAVPIRTKHLYCNMMYTVATHLVETLTKSSFSDFLQDRFFKPLGMNSTNLQPERARQKGLGDRITPGFRWDEDANKYHQFKIPDAPEGQGAGSIITSVNDYVKYVSAIMNQKQPFTKSVYEGIIRARSFSDPDYKERAPLTSATVYAAGWEVTFYRGHMIVSHDGSIAGAGTRHFFLPGIKFGGAIFGNSDGAGTITNILMQELVDEALHIPKKDRIDWEKAIAGGRPDKGSNDGSDDGDDEDPNESIRQELCPGVKVSEPQKKPLTAYTGLYNNKGYHDMKVDVKNGTLHIDASDRSFGFQLDLQHVCDQTKYVGLMSPDNDPTTLGIKAEFVFEGEVAVKMGLFLEDSIEDLIWFERVKRA